TITAPSSCTYHNNPTIQEPSPTVTFLITSPGLPYEIASKSLGLHPGQSRTLTLGPGGDVITAWLFEPDATTDHTILLQADSNCGEPDQQYTIDSVKLDVVAMR